MGRNSDKEGFGLIETPARVEPASDFPQWHTRKRQRKCRKQLENGNHLAELGNALQFLDDETSLDGVSCFEKTMDSPVADAASTIKERGRVVPKSNKKPQQKLKVRRKTYNFVPKVDVDVKPWDTPAPRTPDVINTKHEKPRFSGESSTQKIVQFSHECKERGKKSCRRSLNLDMDHFQKEGQKDLMIDEAYAKNVEFLHSIAAKPSLQSSEGEEHDTRYSRRPQNIIVYHRRKKVEKQVLKELVCSSSLSQGPKKRGGRKMAKPVVVKLKHTRTRKQSKKSLKKRKNIKTSDYKKGMLVPCKKIGHLTPKMQSKVDLDERTVREWNFLMEKLDSERNDETDEGEREWWDKERELLHERVKSFISNMHLIQGGRKFSPWKGSVMDSIGGAYLTQNTNDTLSSAAFISLAAKYPHGAATVNSPVETSIGSSSRQPSGKNVSRSSSSKTKRKNIVPPVIVNERNTKKKGNAISSKDVGMGKENPAKTEDMCFATQTNFTRKRTKKERVAIRGDILKKYYSKGACGKKMCDIPDALDWDAVRMSTVRDVANAIWIRGMNNHLAKRIKNCLNILARDLGSINLEWIRDVPPHEAKEYLLSIPGLGLKSVECIRLLTLLQKAFPIDRNAGRVAVRLGWVPLQPLPEGQEFHLLKEYPKVNSIQMYLWPRLSKHDPSLLYELHCHMITFGKVFCTKRNPNCNACPMRADCKHYASALASSQLALPGIPELALAESMPLLEENCTAFLECAFEAEHVSESQSASPKCLQMVEWDIEDFGLDGIPRIRVDKEKLKENLRKCINEKNIPLEEGEMSKALMVLTSETASIPVPKLKNIKYLRTEHLVYVIPDLHNLLEGLEETQLNDPSPYLLAIWTPDNVEEDGRIQEEEEEEDTVNGTLLIPVRTATRGVFPLNGTFFQANEVFADDESSEVPIKVPRASLWNLQRKILYCGYNISAVCRGMKTHEVQKCFWTGYVCFRGFNRKTREPTPLSARFHLPVKDRKTKQKRTQ